MDNSTATDVDDLNDSYDGRQENHPFLFWFSPCISGHEPITEGSFTVLYVG